MKRLFKNSKIKFTVIFLSITILCIALVTALVITLYKDYKIKSITVNGKTAALNGVTAAVEIEQTDTLNIDIKTAGGIKVKLYGDENLTQEINDFGNIKTDGKDAVLYITTGVKNKVKKTYNLTVINSIADNVANYKINGVKPKLTDGNYSVALPDITANLSIFIEPSAFFSYKFYLDSERKLQIAELSNFTLADNQTKIYCEVYNVNYPGVFKEYAIDLLFNKTDYGKIEKLTVNGIAASFSHTHAEVTVERANLLNIAVSGSNKTKFIFYSDKSLLEEIKNANNIQNFNLSGKPLKYYVKAVSDDGTELIYTLSVKYVLDGNTDIAEFKINGTCAAVNDTEISVLLNRPDYINLEGVCASPYSEIKYYYDYEKVQPVTAAENIDVSDFTGSVYQLFAQVEAEDGAVKDYCVFINFVLSGSAELLDLRANNQTAIIEDNLASLQYIGTPDTFRLQIQNVTVSKYAEYEIFYDSDCTDKADCENEIELTSNRQTLYVKITAENGSFKIVTLTVNLISNDNSIKSITVNGQEFIIASEENTLYVEHNNILQIDRITYDLNSQIGVFYDSLQTVAVEDLSNLNLKNGTAQIYIRVTAENGDIKVYSIKIIIKTAPMPVFKASSIKLDDWQKTIPADELFSMDEGSYNQNQFEYEVYWNGIKQNTGYISVLNERKIYELQITVKSYYFGDLVYTKPIEVIPYTLSPVRASLKINDYAANTSEETPIISDILNIDCGSYIMGRDFYLEVSYPNGRTQIVIDTAARIEISAGTYTFFINAFNDYFETQNLGELKITVAEKEIPVITASDFVEIKADGSVINIADLFEIDKKDYEIILIKTFSNGEEAESIKCDAGIYLFKLQAYYQDGMAEKVIKAEIAGVSDNTDIDLFANGSLIEFTDDSISLPDLNYNDSLVLTGRNYNSKAEVILKVNGAVSSFGELNLNSGGNIITVTVTAESGKSRIYEIYANKNARLLPVVSVQPQTVKLAKYQDFINIGNFYTVNFNDYSAKVNLYYGNTEIFNNILAVENTSEIYNVDIVLTGEFGNISAVLEIGVLPYTDVEVRFNSFNIAAENESYVFSLSDFVSEILYFGIDPSSCRYETTCDNEIFTPSALEEGEHLFTITIWQDNILLKEATRWFNVSFSAPSPEITVTLKEDNVIIPRKTFTANVEDYFEIDYGTYDENALSLRFIYLDSSTVQNSLILQNGGNRFMLQIYERTTERELFINEYNITCNYIAESEKIFKSFSVNGSKRYIDGNDLIFVLNSPFDEVSLEYTANEGFSVFNFPSKVTLNDGLNQIKFPVKEEDGYSYTATLNIYNLGTLEYYVTSVSYKGYVPEDKFLILASETEFDIDELSVIYNSAAHISLDKQVTKHSDDIFDVRIDGTYDGIDIGCIVLRVFLGEVRPSLWEIVAEVRGDGVVSAIKKEYSLDIYAKADDYSVSFSILFGQDKYSLVTGSFSNLNYGVNDLKFSVKDNDTGKEYEYDLQITLFPEDLVSSVKYNEVALAKSNKFYVIENADTADENAVSIALKELPATTAIRPSAVTYNGETVAINYDICFNNTVIQTVCVAVANDNSTVVCERNSTTLTQLGNNVLNDKLRIRKYDSDGELKFIYFFDCVYPLTYILDEKISFEQYLGYHTIVDLSYLLSESAGSYTHTLDFDVYTVSSKFTYTLKIDVELYEVNAENAYVTLNIGTDTKLYFEESELDGYYVYSYENIDLDIDVKEVAVSIESKNNDYYIYDGKTAGTSLNAEVSYRYNTGYFIQLQIGASYYDRRIFTINLNEYKNDGGEIIETACIFGGQQINILENTVSQEIEYSGQTYTVSVAENTLYLPQGTAETEVKIYGCISEQEDFVLKNGVGTEGVLTVSDGHLLLLISNETHIPYAIINVEFV